MRIRRAKRRNCGQVALEYALTTVFMAILASMLYLFYQPVLYAVFEAVHATNPESGREVRDKGLGMREALYLPVP